MPTAPPLTDADRWRAVSSRDPAFASAFVYGVTTTKIYCRPNCPSRLARRANVVFFASAAAAAADKAGFRPCKRCKPSADQQRGDADSPPPDGAEKVNRALAIIIQRATAATAVAATPLPSLADLAGEVGLSKWHLQREFKRRVGVSPREMAERVRKSASTQPQPDVQVSMPFDSVLEDGNDAGLAIPFDFDLNDFIQEDCILPPLPPAAAAASIDEMGVQFPDDNTQQQMAILHDLFPEIYTSNTSNRNYL